MRMIWAIIFTLLLIAETFAAETATLSGRFVLDGPIPKPQALAIPAGVGKGATDESLLVDLETHGIANIVVSMYLKPGEESPKAPPAKDIVTLHSELLRFEPRITVVCTGLPLLIVNEDARDHGLKIDLLGNAPIAKLLPSESELAIRLSEAEKLPVALSDNIHPWKHGYLFVTEHPYAAVTDKVGRFSIPDLPPGKWTFRIWHERAGFVEHLKRDGEVVEWDKGRVTLDLKPGDNNLGWLEVSPQEFP